MNKKSIFIPMMIIILVGIVNACVFSNRIEFYHPMDLDGLKVSLKDSRKDYDVLNETVLIYYKDFIVSVNVESATITCKEVATECMDNSTFRDVLEDLEDWGAYDISKEDKDTIAELYQPNIVIKELNRRELIVVRIKASVLKFLGRLFCTNYENVLSCNEDWCGIQVLKSDKCLYFREKC